MSYGGIKKCAAELKGKKLVSVLRDGDYFAFVADDGTYLKLSVEGDCCSHSWVEHINVPAGAIGATITGVEDGEPLVEPAISDEEMKKYDVLAVYEFRLNTSAGPVCVEYRNDSNGYYGGNTVGPYTNGLKGMNEVTK